MVGVMILITCRANRSNEICLRTLINRATIVSAWSKRLRFRYQWKRIHCVPSWPHVWQRILKKSAQCGFPRGGNRFAGEEGGRGIVMWTQSEEFGFFEMFFRSRKISFRQREIMFAQCRVWNHVRIGFVPNYFSFRSQTLHIEWRRNMFFWKCKKLSFIRLIIFSRYPSNDQILVTINKEIFLFFADPHENDQ